MSLIYRQANSMDNRLNIYHCKTMDISCNNKKSENWIDDFLVDDLLTNHSRNFRTFHELDWCNIKMGRRIKITSHFDVYPKSHTTPKAFAKQSDMKHRTTLFDQQQPAKEGHNGMT
jgi:hypothetical protein